MIDEDLKLYLIEINTNPDITVCCGLLQKLIPTMIDNALRIAVDPVFPPTLLRNRKIGQLDKDNSIVHNRFELIFDSELRGEGLKELFKGHKT